MPRVVYFIRRDEKDINKAMRMNHVAGLGRKIANRIKLCDRYSPNKFKSIKTSLRIFDSSYCLHPNDVVVEIFHRNTENIQYDVWIDDKV